MGFIRKAVRCPLYFAVAFGIHLRMDEESQRYISREIKYTVLERAPRYAALAPSIGLTLLKV